MFRLILCLLLCLVLAPASLPRRLPMLAPSGDDPVLLSVTDDGSPLPDDDAMRLLASKDPILFLENCLRRCGREVHGFQALLSKHERIDGELLPPELVRVSFREQPNSTLLQWVKGARLAGSALYVRGENNDKALVRPAGLLSLVGIVELDPLGAEARQNGRYALPDFGIRIGMERTLASWVSARKRGHLHVEYLGTKPIPELSNRVCHVLHRTGYENPEHDGVTDLMVYIDRENWLHVGSVLHGDGGELIAAYYFRDLRINPTFPANYFTRQGMP